MQPGGWGLGPVLEGCWPGWLLGFLIQELDDRQCTAGRVVGFPEVISDGRKLADPLTPECQARSLQELANPPVLTSLWVSHREWAGLPGARGQWVAGGGIEEEEQDADKQPQKQGALPRVGPWVGKGCPSSSRVANPTPAHNQEAPGAVTPGSLVPGPVRRAPCGRFCYSE